MNKNWKELSYWFASIKMNSIAKLILIMIYFDIITFRNQYNLFPVLGSSFSSFSTSYFLVLQQTFSIAVFLSFALRQIFIIIGEYVLSIFEELYGSSKTHFTSLPSLMNDDLRLNYHEKFGSLYVIITPQSP